jgi:hypothetical protein
LKEVTLFYWHILNLALCSSSFLLSLSQPHLEAAGKWQFTVQFQSLRLLADCKLIEDVIVLSFCFPKND